MVKSRQIIGSAGHAMRLLQTGLLVFSAILACPAAYAEDIAKWYINAAAGVQQYDPQRDLDDAITGIYGLERRLSPHWALELRFMASSLDNSNDLVALDGSETKDNLDLLYYFSDGAGFEPYVAGGISNARFSTRSNGRDSEVQANLGGGARYIFNHHWSIRGDARYFHSLDEDYGDTLVSLGVSYAFGKITTRRPVVAKPLFEEPVEEPVAKPVSDPPAAELNLDELDPCDRPVFCAECLADEDGDGIADPRDSCPSTLQCVRINHQGCAVRPQRGVRLEGVHFEFNSARLMPETQETLRRMGAALRGEPDLRVEIAGHTDNTGADAYNFALSQQRADAVREWLIANEGIPPERLSARGYGESSPVANNDTEEGQRRNRRVELHLE